jgi:hypothetical protein
VILNFHIVLFLIAFNFIDIPTTLCKDILIFLIFERLQVNNRVIGLCHHIMKCQHSTLVTIPKS